MPRNFTIDEQKSGILRTSLLTFFDATITTFTVSPLLLGTFLIITTPSVTELTRKFSFHIKKSIRLIAAEEKQEYKNFSIRSPSVLFSKDF